jgi:hypothetical protein
MHRSIIITILVILWWAHVWIPALISTWLILRFTNLGDQIKQLDNATLHWNKATLDPVSLSVVVEVAIGLAKESDILEVRNPGGRDILHDASASNPTHFKPAFVRILTEHRVHRPRAQRRPNKLHRVGY